MAVLAYVQYCIYADIVGGSERVPKCADIIKGWSLTSTLFLNHVCRSTAGRGFTILLIEACLKKADSSLVLFFNSDDFSYFSYFRMVASQQQLGGWRARCGLHT